MQMQIDTNENRYALMLTLWLDKIYLLDKLKTEQIAKYHSEIIGR